MKYSKLIFDYTLALSSLIVLLSPCLLLFILSSLDTKQKGIFIQKRIGRNGIPFNLLKFRTMKGEYSSSITTNEMKITSFGKFLRKYKLDEIPQIINILKGEMSWIGPRPDVAGYADKLSGKERIILTVKPGITGPAQLKYKNEEEILSQVENPKQYNDEIIWKDKIIINIEYIKNWSFTKDIKYLIQTFFNIF